MHRQQSGATVLGVTSEEYKSQVCPPYSYILEHLGGDRSQQSNFGGDRSQQGNFVHFVLIYSSFLLFAFRLFRWPCQAQSPAPTIDNTLPSAPHDSTLSLVPHDSVLSSVPHDDTLSLRSGLVSGASGTFLGVCLFVCVLARVRACVESPPLPDPASCETVQASHQHHHCNFIFFEKMFARPRSPPRPKPHNLLISHRLVL